MMSLESSQKKDIIIDSNSKVTLDELSASSKTWLTKYMSK